MTYVSESQRTILLPRIATDPVDELVERVRPQLGQAVDALQVAAVLEAAGHTDRTARVEYGYTDVFTLALEVFRRIGPTAPTNDAAGTPVPARLGRWHGLRPISHGPLVVLPSAAFPAVLAMVGRSGLVLGLILAGTLGWVYSGLAAYSAHRVVGQGGLAIDFVEEDRPLSTVGPLFALKDTLPDDFLVMNGDILTDLDYANLLATHTGAGAGLTVATSERVHRIDFGVLDVDAGRIVGFREKPAPHYPISMGVYAMSRKVLAPYPPGLSLGFDQLVLDLLAAGEQPATYPFDGFWLDIGRPEDYDEANRASAQLIPILLPGVRSVAPAVDPADAEHAVAERAVAERAIGDRTVAERAVAERAIGERAGTVRSGERV